MALVSGAFRGIYFGSFIVVRAASLFIAGRALLIVWLRWLLFEKNVDQGRSEEIGASLWSGLFGVAEGWGLVTVMKPRLSRPYLVGVHRVVLG